MSITHAATTLSGDVVMHLYMDFKIEKLAPKRVFHYPDNTVGK